MAKEVTELTKEQQMAAKVRKAVEDASKDGMVSVKVTLAGGGEIHSGKGTRGRREQDEVFETTVESAVKLASMGYVDPVKPSKAKDA